MAAEKDFCNYQITVNKMDDKSQYNFFNRRVFDEKCETEMENAITQVS